MSAELFPVNTKKSMQLEKCKSNAKASEEGCHAFTFLSNSLAVVRPHFIRGRRSRRACRWVSCPCWCCRGVSTDSVIIIVQAIFFLKNGTLGLLI
ncbi:hypothetical protein SK128_005270 [Halocaridina rubra]|uniref:Uncharacterized protein n=1 Tax=Halocaridina rubra TaxID=373956 RepID=A0AAN8XMX6_HALRR